MPGAGAADLSLLFLFFKLKKRLSHKKVARTGFAWQRKAKQQRISALQPDLPTLAVIVHPSFGIARQ
jgi:hypothetical protein